MSDSSIKQNKDTKTFVANIRCDIRYIATIARFIASRGEFMQTKAKLASEAVRILAHGIPEEFQVKEYREAKLVLIELEYGDIEDKVSYYKSINSMINIENNRNSIVENSYKESMELSEKINREEFNRKQNTNKAQQEKAQEQLAEAGTLVSDSEHEPEPENSEPKQKKVHTAADERADIKDQNAAFAGPPPTVVENEGGES